MVLVLVSYWSLICILGRVAEKDHDNNNRYKTSLSHDSFAISMCGTETNPHRIWRTTFPFISHAFTSIYRYPAYSFLNTKLEIWNFKLLRSRRHRRRPSEERRQTDTQSDCMWCVRARMRLFITYIRSRECELIRSRGKCCALMGNIR